MSTRIGRRRGLIATLAIMGAATILIALTPGYRTIGILAPLLVLVGRLLQGFSAGVELGSVSVYLSEMATPATKLLCQLAIGQQQSCDVAAAADRVRAQRADGPPNWRVGLADPVFSGLHDRALIFVIRRPCRRPMNFLAREHHPDMREVFPLR